MNYDEFLKSKISNIKESGFNIKESELNSNLFDFQKYIVKKALKKGKFAIFAECGLGKTIMQLEFAFQVAKKTKGKSLILTPLAVAKQTKEEASKFGIDLQQIDIINYESLHKIDTQIYNCVVLDESSILKNFTGKYKKLIIKTFNKTPYKLSCTATPSPNDLNELGNQSEFLNVLDAQDMRAKWFVRDEGMNNYRLKGHAKIDFFNWVNGWSLFIRNPSDIGFDGKNYKLPKLNLYSETIKTALKDETKLFNSNVVNATSFSKELRRTLEQRLDKATEIAREMNNCLIWVKLNDEADYLSKKFDELGLNYVEVRGSEKTEVKEQKLLDFAKGKYQYLITKAKIAQFGLNFQNCNNQIFASLDFSYESLHQSIRRSYRFGQKQSVNCYFIQADTMENVIKSINYKQNLFKDSFDSFLKYKNENIYKLVMEYEMKHIKKSNYEIFNGDCVEMIDKIEDNSIDFSVFSPPFSNIFTYSNNLRDMGNSLDNDEFFNHYKFLLKKLYDKIKPGRLIAVHTKDLARYKNSSGYSGLYDFTGENHRAIEEVGFKYHSKVTIWTDPVLEMQRTKTQRLLYKQVTSDSSKSGFGLPEYVTIFKKWEGNEEDWAPVNSINKQNFDLDTWQKWASPVWFDIKRTDVLTSYTKVTEGKDEKHICPLQLGVIERLLYLYSNEGETVLSPFAGIGSEGYESLRLGRKFIGFELKESYFNEMAKNLNEVVKISNQLNLF